MSDAVNPDHYKRLPAEAIEIIESMIAGAPDNKAAYLHGQGAKYDLRLWEKGKSLEDFLSDWQKHIWYALRLERHLIELVEKQTTNDPNVAPYLASEAIDEALQQAELTEEPQADPEYRHPHPGDVGKRVEVRDSTDTSSDDARWVERTLVAVIAVPLDQDVGKFVAAVDGYDNTHICHLWRHARIKIEHPKPQADHSADADKMVEMPVVKQSLTPEPPDGWRWLEVGEVIREGDRYFSGDQWKDRNWAIGETYSPIHQKTIRRNRFEVGEKVVHVGDNPPIVYIVDVIRADGAIIAYNRNIGYAFSPDKLAPYIEETK